MDKCLRCGKPTEWKKPYHLHVRLGDEWLYKRIAEAKYWDCNKWFVPYRSYICSECEDEICYVHEQMEHINRCEMNESSRIRLAEYYANPPQPERGPEPETFDPQKLREMPYRQFLYSPYWRAVRRLKQILASFKCEKCGEWDYQLQVHHLTYEHRGDEHNHLDDLMVLCSYCHEEIHAST